MSPFEALTFSEKRLVYLGLLSLVTSNSGHGFCNNDQGHPAYAIGSNGGHDYQQWGDSPEHNQLFRMMHSLSVELNAADEDKSSEISDYVFSWADFCRIATEANKKTRSNG